LQDAQLDDGARVHIVHGDIARGGHVLVNIRKFTGIPFRALGELVERDMLSPQVAAFLRACVRARLSIVFAGPPGSGKTTLLSCSTAELDPGLRVVVAEEVFESDVPVPNVAQMQTRAARPDRPEVDLRRLVAGFLRMTPDVAIVGDVRDRERFRTSLTLSKVEFDACPRERQSREPTRDRRPRQGSGAYAGAKLPSTDGPDGTSSTVLAKEPHVTGLDTSCWTGRPSLLSGRPQVESCRGHAGALGGCVLTWGNRRLAASSS
jgi:hypothetical protein